MQILIGKKLAGRQEMRIKDNFKDISLTQCPLSKNYQLAKVMATTQIWILKMFQAPPTHCIGIFKITRRSQLSSVVQKHYSSDCKSSTRKTERCWIESIRMHNIWIRSETTSMKIVLSSVVVRRGKYCLPHSWSKMEHFQKMHQSLTCSRLLQWAINYRQVHTVRVSSTQKQGKSHQSTCQCCLEESKLSPQGTCTDHQTVYLKITFYQQTIWCKIHVLQRNQYYWWIRIQLWTPKTHKECQIRNINRVNSTIMTLWLPLTVSTQIKNRIHRKRSHLLARRGEHYLQRATNKSWSNDLKRARNEKMNIEI